MVLFKIKTEPIHNSMHNLKYNKSTNEIFVMKYVI